MKWIGAFFAVAITVAVVMGGTPRPTPVINLDSNAHTITQKIWCDGNTFLSIDTYVDGQFQFTTYFPPQPPSGVAVR